MQTFRFTNPADRDAIANILDRSTTTAPEVEETVATILAAVKRRGDAAVAEYTQKFEGRAPAAGGYEIPRARWAQQAASINHDVRAALELAAARIRAFHELQREDDVVSEGDGMRLELRVRAMRRAGIYVPGGTALYPSSVLMTAIPARVAGVEEIIMVTPGASAETLAAAKLAGVDRVFEIGGAQAVAALAYGTDTVPRVDIIVGPGNQYVAVAKRMVFGEVAIDSVAGPSEVMIIADESAEPAWIAADLLAQAEHDVVARAILVTTSEALVTRVESAIISQLAALERHTIAGQSLRDHGVALLVPDLDAAISFANDYAPEHLELHLPSPRTLLDRFTSAGAIFVGPYTPEAVGDYIAGPNHVLPTGGAGRYASPLGVHDFRKRISVLEYSREALAAHRDAIVAIARTEGLTAHARSATIRFDD